MDFFLIKASNSKEVTTLQFIHLGTGEWIEMGGVVWKHQEDYFLYLIINPKDDS